jgi:hypothetical protein
MLIHILARRHAQLHDGFADEIGVGQISLVREFQ